MEDTLLRLRDENLSLKKQNNELADHSKRLAAKLNIMDISMHKVGGGGSATTALKTEIAARQLQEELESVRRQNKQLQAKLRHQENDTTIKAIIQGRTVPYGRLPRPVAGKLAVGIDVGIPGSGGAIRPPSRSRSRSRSMSRERGVLDDSSLNYQTARALATSGLNVSTAGHGQGRGPGLSASSMASPTAGTPAAPPVPPATPAIDPAVHARLISAESSAAQLRSENAALRSQLASSNGHMSPLRASNASALNASAQSGGNGHTIAIPRGDLIELERQLKEKTSQVLLLKSRYDSLEAKAAAERDVYDRTVSTLEEQNAQLRDARSALQAAEADLSILRSRLRGSEDTDVELRAARDEIKRLERALTDLCESPFISEGRDAVSKRQRLESAEKELSSLKEQVTHLQHTVRSQHSELTILRKEKRELADAAERLKEEADKARMAADTSGRAAALMRERLALYSGVVGGPDALTVGSTPPSTGGAQTSTAVVTGGGKDSENLAALMAVPSEELQRALVLVRKRLDTPGSTAAGGPAEDNGPDAVPALRRKVQQLQLALVSSQRELERCEAMLKAQTTIAADLGAEVAELNQRLGHEGLDLRKRLADTEALAERRLQRVQLLEAQVRQLLSKVKELQSSKRAARSLADTAQARGRPEKGKAKARAHDDDDDASTVISDLSGEGRPGNGPEASAERMAGLADMDDSVDLSSSLLDVGPGEAALEVYVIEAHIDPAVLGRHDTTFALLDFYDFESQSSPLASGTSPYYNFSAQYRVTVDPFFLRHVAGEAGGVRVDVHQAKGSDFQLVARAQLPLRKLLLSSVTKARYTAIPLLSRDGRIVGHMRAEVRTGAALAPLWEAFCKSKPAEGAALTAAMRSKETMAEEDALLPTSAGLSASGTVGLAASSTAMPSNANELAVTVVAASGLRSSIGMHAPSVYVQYTLPLPGLAPVSTPIASDSSNPVYSDARSFPLTVTQRTLAQLAATPLMFSVYEESTHARSVSRDSTRAKSLLLGTAAVSLALVAEGGSVDGTYDIADSRGVPAGKLQVRIAWAHSLSFADAAASNSMSRGQVQSLASIVDKDGSGVKIGLLCTLAGITTGQAKAVAAVRDALAASLRGYEASAATEKPTGSKYSQKHSLKWSEALQGAADGVSVRARGPTPGQGQGMLTAREVYDAITAPAVGAALDYSTVEDAVSALTATGSVSCAVSDLCDAFSTWTPVATAALNRLRDMVPRFTASGRTLSDTAGPRKEGVAALKAALESCARQELSSSSHTVLGATLATSTAGAPLRISRSGLGAALKSLGVVVTEDHGASTGRPSDPRMAPDFYSDPARDVTVEGGLRHGQEQEEDISDLSVSLGHAPTEGDELKPTAVSAAATTGAGAHTVTTAAGGGGGVQKELRFESGATTPQSGQGPVPVHTVVGPSMSSNDAGITLEVGTVGRLSTALQAALPDLPGGQPTSMYLTYTFPAQVKAGSSMLPRTAVYVCALPTNGLKKDSVLSVAPYSQCTGAGTAFGQTTTFPLPKGSPLSAHILAAFAPKAAPEESDVAFVLSSSAPSIDKGSGLPLFSSPEAVLGRAIFSLDDLLDAGEDVTDYSLPIQASQALVGLSKSKAASGGSSTPSKGLTAGSTVAEVTISVSGFALVSGLEKQATA